MKSTESAELRSSEYVLQLDVSKAYTLGRNSYILYTTEGEFIRDNQPCYGELRKYESTHKGECTQPNNPKPGDLKHPFPDGIPQALIIPFNTHRKSSDTDFVLESMFSQDSPWVSGFGEVTFFKRPADNGHKSGVILHHLVIDPTVLVNALKQLQGFLQPNIAKDIVDLVTEGMTPNEAMAVMMLNSSSVDRGVGMTDGYKAPTRFSARRFFTQNPVDLSGGVLRDRIDYNRTDMHKPFWSDSGMNWTEEAKKAGLPSFSYDKPIKRSEALKDFARIGKEVFAKAIEKEPTPENKPFLWKTTSGKENGSAIATAV